MTRPFVGSTTKMFDGEGMAYVAVDGTLWLADDNGDSLYEVDVATGMLLSTIDAAMLATVLEFGGGPEAGSDRSGDLEAVAYDEASDILYAVSNGCCAATSEPAIFRLTRSGSTFAPESWQLLPDDMPGAAATPDGDLYLSSGAMMHTYDYVTNTLGAGFTITNLLGTMTGLSFSADGHDLWVGTGLRVYRVDWATTTVVPDYEFDIVDHGLGDSRAVESIGDFTYVLDGDDSLDPTDPLKYAIHIYSINGTNLSPITPVSSVTATPAVGLAPLTVDLDASASFDPDGTIDVYHWFVAGGPLTSTFVPTHQLEFTTPGVYVASVTVEDNGQNLKGSSTPVVVKEPNVAPVLDPVGNQSVDELVELAFTATATDANVPVDVLTFSLDGAVPAGASITPGGNFTWTPTEAQGPGVYPFDVVVTDDGIPSMEDRETIEVTVNEVGGNTAPVLDLIGDQMVDEGTELAFTATASDVDVPPQVLTFSLDGAVPAGASITPGGNFTWTPTEAQGPGVYPFDVVVTDDGIPSMEDRETITVTVLEVNECPRTVQHGTTTSTADAVTSASITTVDPNTAFLVFSTRHDSNRPVASVIRGRINGSGNAVEFVRVTNEATPVPMTMEWYVVEYECGVRVQRGEIAPSDTVVDVPITPVASTSQAFVTWSKTVNAGDSSFGNNDHLVAELTSTSNLQLRTNNGASGHMVAWQVIEFTDAADISVQTGSTSMTGTTTSITDTIPVAVDLSRTFILVDYRSGGSGADIGSRMIRAELTDPTTITVSRQASGSPDDITEITWQVVELLEGSTVQSGTQHFDTGVGQHDIAITPVDTSRAFAMGSVQSGSGQNLGESPYVGDDLIGVGAVTTDLTASQLTLRRDSTIAAADVTWFVVG